MDDRPPHWRYLSYRVCVCIYIYVQSVGRSVGSSTRPPRPPSVPTLAGVLVVLVAVVTRTHARRKRWCVRATARLDLDLDLDEKRRDRVHSRARPRERRRRTPWGPEGEDGSPRSMTDRSRYPTWVTRTRAAGAPAVCARRWCARAVVTTRKTRRKNRSTSSSSSSSCAPSCARRIVAGVDGDADDGGDARSVDDGRWTMTTTDGRARDVGRCACGRARSNTSSSSSSSSSSSRRPHHPRPTHSGSVVPLVPPAPGRGIHGEEALMHSRGL